MSGAKTLPGLRLQIFETRLTGTQVTQIGKKVTPRNK